MLVPLTHVNDLFTTNSFVVKPISLSDTADEYAKAAKFLVKCWQGHGFRTNGYKVGWKNDVQGRERLYAL